MKADFVYIAYSADDASEVAEVADNVRHAGWDVCFGHFAEPGNDDFSLNMERLAGACCVVAVWSSSAANSAIVRSDATEAARRSKLVVIGLDDAALPASWKKVARFYDILGIRDPQAMASLTDAIRPHALQQRRGRGQVVSYARAGGSASLWPAPVGLAALLAAMAVAGSFLWFLTDPPARSANEGALAPSGGIPPVVADTASSSREWARVPKDDLSAIRAYIREYEGSRSAYEAIRHVQRLEQFAWQDILDHDDLTTQLDRLARYRIDFPNGEHNSLAIELEGRCRQTVESLRTNLILLGFLAPGAEGENKLRAGVEAFERSIGREASGRITESLAGHISVAAERRLSSANR